MKIALFANSDWYLYNFRLPLARSLRSRGDEVVLISPSGPYGPKMIEEGFRWIDFPLSRMGINPLAELHTISRLMMVYRRERPDIAHHFTIKCVLYGGLAARGAGGFATVSSLTGLGHLFTSNTLRARISRPFAKMIYRRVLERSTVIFQNPDDARDFASIGLVRDGRSRVIRGSGVDLVRFRPLENKVNGSGETVLLVGRLISEKGIGEFVEAARIVRRPRPRTRFLVAGDVDPGNPSSIEQKLLAAWQAEGIVQFLGHRNDIPALLHAADLVVLPSYREGTPRSLLEAAASGIPLIASDVPGCREVVRHGANGLLVPPRNAHALAGAILELLEDPARRVAMGAKSREIAVAEFAQESVIRATLDAYTMALAT